MTEKDSGPSYLTENCIVQSIYSSLAQPREQQNHGQEPLKV